MSEIDPRYANYARYHGRTPAEQLELDRDNWRSDIMAGFTRWNEDMMRAYSKERLGSAFKEQPVDQEGYDAWLTALVDRRLELLAGEADIMQAETKTGRTSTKTT